MNRRIQRRAKKLNRRRKLSRWLLCRFWSTTHFAPGQIVLDLQHTYSYSTLYNVDPPEEEWVTHIAVHIGRVGFIVHILLLLANVHHSKLPAIRNYKGDADSNYTQPFAVDDEACMLVSNLRSVGSKLLTRPRKTHSALGHPVHSLAE